MGGPLPSFNSYKPRCCAKAKALHIQPFNGRALQAARTKTSPSDPCQDGQLRYHGYQWKQRPLLTAAFVGWQPRETKCHFLALSRHMHNHCLGLIMMNQQLIHSCMDEQQQVIKPHNLGFVFLKPLQFLSFLLLSVWN